MSKKSVCIIGAGLSGLVTCKVFREDRDMFDVTVYEKTSDLGGVWNGDRAYGSLCTNNAKHTFGFADLEIPESFDEYPSAKQMLSYFNRYVDMFKLRESIVFNAEVSKVTEIKEGSDIYWEVVVSIDGVSHTRRFDLLVVASGLFEHAFVPSFPNASSFQGTIIHSSKTKDKTYVEGKRVLVVGCGKSAADMATMGAHHALSTHMVFRHAHWIMPQYAGGAVSTRYCLYNRMIAYLLPYYDLEKVDHFVQHVLSLTRMVFNVVALGAIMDSKLPKDSIFIPDIPMLSDMSISIAPSGYYEAIQQGKITAAKTSIKEFVPNSKIVRFQDGSQGEYDVVIMATGFAQGFPFFSSDMSKRLDLPQWSHSGREGEDAFRLYRYLVPTKGNKNVGFVGFLSTSVNATVYELGAHWLTEYFTNNIKNLPSPEGMQDDVRRRVEYEKVIFPSGKGVGYALGGAFLAYTATLLRDMGIQPHPRTSNVFSEYLAPFRTTQFQYVQAHKVAARTVGPPTSSPVEKKGGGTYLSALHVVVIVVILSLLISYYTR